VSIRFLVRRFQKGNESERGRKVFTCIKMYGKKPKKLEEESICEKINKNA
jgi:hypothetical protein